MEIVLLIFVFAFLIFLKNASDRRFDILEEKFKYLQRSIENLKKVEPVLEKKIAIIEKVIPAPIPDIPKIEPVIEEFKPILVELPKTVLSANNDIPKVVFQKPEPKPYIPKKSWWENFKDQNPDLEKFIGENLINKIGVLILVLGISYFVKYSIDKGWIGEPARVGIGLLSGALVLGVAHKLRKKFAAFSSVFVAGAIAIFYFTIGIAFHDYHLFNQTVAFVIMIFITAFSCLISVSYDRKELAILSLIGGFAIPFMVSTGKGNFAVLLSYILILDIGILALAYFKKWNIINILSYIFTVLLFGGWLFQELNEKNPHYLGGLLFGFAFYFVFILINIINNIRTKGTFSVIELSILASNTFLFYAAGILILNNFHPEYRGLFTTVLGLLNFLYAWFLYKKFGLNKNAVYLLIGLTLTFITLAIPVQFSGNYITLFWSAEAVLLLWLSQKSKIVSYKFASVIITFLMIVSLIMDWNTIYTNDFDLNIVLNKIFIAGIVSIISLVCIYYLLKNETNNSEQFGIIFNPIQYSKVIQILAIVMGYFVGLFEVCYQADAYVYGANSAIDLPILYHLVFSLILFFYLCKDKNIYKIQLSTILGITNIILFMIWFSNYSFYEHEQYIATGIYQRIGFYLHYLMLIIILYFGSKIYKNQNENTIFEFLNHKLTKWVMAFLVIFVATKELLLHGLVLSNIPVTNSDINNSKMLTNFSNDIPYIKSVLAEQFIATVRDIIIRTGFPILWGILAFLFLIIGIKKQNKTLRIIALSLLGITIAKLFLYDIRNASETGKIIAFILLGILVLIISFVYQKIKVLVLDDNKKEKE